MFFKDYVNPNKEETKLPSLYVTLADHHGFEMDEEKILHTGDKEYIEQYG